MSYSPVALRAYVEQARLERRSLRIKDVEWRRAGEVVWYEVHVNPLVGKDKKLLGVSVVFHDVSWARQLLTELEHTNRQLESAYEELQSTNEELQTINDALRERTLDLDEVNEFLESVLTSVKAGIVVVDREMRVKAWNRGAEDMWGVRREEAEGRHLLTWTSACRSRSCARRSGTRWRTRRSTARSCWTRSTAAAGQRWCTCSAVRFAGRTGRARELC